MEPARKLKSTGGHGTPGVKILFAWVYSSPPPSPSAGNESHLAGFDLGERRAWTTEGIGVHRGRQGKPNYALKCSHPPGLSGRAFPSFSLSRIGAALVVRPIRVTRTPATTDGTVAADVNSSS